MRTSAKNPDSEGKIQSADEIKKGSTAAIFSTIPKASSLEIDESTPLQQEVTDALSILGINIPDKTDPDFMKKLFDQTGLNSFTNNNQIENQSFHLFQKLKTEAIPLASFKAKILNGMVANPPLFKTLIEASALIQGKQPEKKGTLGVDRAKQVKYAIHFMVILEVLTTLMLNDRQLSARLMDSQIQNRGVQDTGSSLSNFWNVLKNTKNLFAAIKLISVDPGMWRFRCWREYSPKPTQENVEAFIKEHQLKGPNATFLRKAIDEEIDQQHRGARTNIVEACCSESGSVENAQAACALIAVIEKGNLPTSFQQRQAIPKTVSEQEEKDFWGELYSLANNETDKNKNTVSKIGNLSKEWVDLYESWNMAFVVGKFPDMFHLILPKLLIPSTLSADPEIYMAARVFSLWLTLNFINSMMAQKQKIDLNFTPPLEMTELLKIWGRNNKEYACNTLLSCTPDALNAMYKNNFHNGSILSLPGMIYSIQNGRNISEDTTSSSHLTASNSEGTQLKNMPKKNNRSNP